MENSIPFTTRFITMSKGKADHPQRGKLSFQGLFFCLHRMRDIEKNNKDHPEKVFELMGFSGFETISSVKQNG